MYFALSARLFAALMLSHACALPLAHAQAYPARPIRILVGFPPGGPTDVLARIVGDKMAEQMGQPAIVDNRPGAAGNIAAELTAKATPDGHTILYSSNAIAVSPALYQKLGFDPAQDLLPITETGAKRSSALPDLKTLGESDLPGFEVNTWQGVFAPAGLPPAIAARLNAELARAVRSPELKPRLLQLDMEPTGLGLKEFNAAYRKELARWAKVAKDAGIKPE